MSEKRKYVKMSEKIDISHIDFKLYKPLEESLKLLGEKDNYFVPREVKAKAQWEKNKTELFIRGVKQDLEKGIFNEALKQNKLSKNEVVNIIESAGLKVPGDLQNNESNIPRKKKERLENDAYQTPWYSIQSLLDVCDLSKVKSLYEPCKGAGNIYNANEFVGMDKGHSEIEEGKDYLKELIPALSFDLIMTNPPFILAKEFLEKSLTEAYNVFYLLRLGYLASKDRIEFWKRIGRPNKLMVLSQRPKFAHNASDSQEYAWFCWDRENIIQVPDGIHVLEYQNVCRVQKCSIHKTCNRRQVPGERTACVNFTIN